MKSKKVFVAMSGGVDSSVAAALLKNDGFDVVGVHMKCYNVDGCAEQDVEDARRAAEVLGIPFYVFDFEKEYKEAVVKYMVDGYRKGITPNPDVMCNKEIKFGLFLKKALEIGADYVATGHYVKLLPQKNLASSVLAGSPLGRRLQRADHAKPAAGVLESKIFLLAIAKDKNKDQSYFLWTLTQKQLKHCLFPIGDYKKPDVRKLAKKFGLPNAEKKDSQGICFLGRVSLPDFLQNYIKPRKGAVLDVHGNKIGDHWGAYFYTIGQRGGLGIGGFKKPLYVAAKDVKRNIITVAEGGGNPILYKKEVELININLLDQRSRIRIYEKGISVFARVRYRQPLASALFLIRNSKFKLIFKKPMKFVAPGQSAVFYDAKGMMLGGGIIV